MRDEKEKLMHLADELFDKKQIIKTLLEIPTERVWRQLADELFDKKGNELLEQLNKDIKELQKEKDDIERLKKYKKIMARRRKYDEFVRLYMNI